MAAPNDYFSSLASSDGVKRALTADPNFRRGLEAPLLQPPGPTREPSLVDKIIALAPSLVVKLQ